jgi:hypothetical protein
MLKFVPASADVAHERVDDEVIAINLATGAYFSMTGAAADCWTLLVGGTAPDAAAQALAERYGTDLSLVQADVSSLAGRLVEEGLLAERPTANGSGRDQVVLPAQAPGTYRTPALEKFDDMEELLLLDPIHDVDSAGWPLLPTEPA